MCAAKLIIIAILLLCIVNDNEKNRKRVRRVRRKCRRRVSAVIGNKLDSDSESESDSDVMVYWFMRPKCPYCVQMQSAWDHVKVPQPYKKETIDIGNHPAMADKYGVKSVPHIVKQYPSGHVSVYEGDRSTRSLKKWIMNK